ncbi:MAG TPA: prepilin-type N-terminal cleavage/methylation domain-containing protein [Candidatus Dormibacteraeota bacterium]|nr:prepilin-type N-terminal cleavage/methylation domain-containing protein [Candidatus Dormibacteraeota bacterium]
MTRRISDPLQAGFSMIELMIVCAILAIVMASVVRGVDLTVQRSQAEQIKVDLTQEGREFVDEFERDLHQAGYPNCRTVAAPGLGATPNCPADNTNPTEAMNSNVAAGLVYVSNTKLIFEGAIDGSGTVYSVQYRLVDSAGNFPPATTCPCTIQRSEMAKVNGTMPLLQPVTWSQELQNVVNSGVPGGTTAYGNGLAIAGNTAWGATNSSFYAAISSFKDYPVFQAYDQSGNIVALPLDITTPNGTAALTCAAASTSCVKSVRLTINLLANATTGADLQTKVRPVTTMVGNARLVNN